MTRMIHASVCSRQTKHSTTTKQHRAHNSKQHNMRAAQQHIRTQQHISAHKSTTHNTQHT